MCVSPTSWSKRTNSVYFTNGDPSRVRHIYMRYKRVQSTRLCCLGQIRSHKTWSLFISFFISILHHFKVKAVLAVCACCVFIRVRKSAPVRAARALCASPGRDKARRRRRQRGQQLNPRAACALPPIDRRACERASSDRAEMPRMSWWS